jgi:hypothetical protein
LFPYSPPCSSILHTILFTQEESPREQSHLEYSREWFHPKSSSPPPQSSLKHITILHYCTKITSINIRFNVKCLHKGHKININSINLILWYSHLRHKMLASFFKWFMQYPNFGHKICMSKEKLMKIINLKRMNKLW